jgi:hypothetical protein
MKLLFFRRVKAKTKYDVILSQIAVKLRNEFDQSDDYNQKWIFAFSGPKAL